MGALPCPHTGALPEANTQMIDQHKHVPLSTDWVTAIMQYVLAEQPHLQQHVCAGVVEIRLQRIRLGHTAEVHVLLQP